MIEKTDQKNKNKTIVFRNIAMGIFCYLYSYAYHKWGQRYKRSYELSE